MSSPANNSAADSVEVMAALDSYLSRLQRGELVNRQELLTRHPELAGALDCLDALDSLAAPPSEKPPPTSPGVSDATVVFREGVAEEPASTGQGELPDEFGDYQLLSELGRGGMGVVYRARQKSLDRIVALKVVLGNRLASADSVRRFQVEAKLAAGLHHPNIVRVFEAGQVDGLSYLAMEFVEGASLDQLAAGGPMDPLAAARCVATVARAVDHLHREGVVHRDLKPSNILIDEAGRPYVTDFGLAKMFADETQLTRTGDRLGTASYMAPEQAAGKTNEVGPLSDVYSLGAILYELLTGRPPFRGDNVLDILVQVVEREAELPRKLNPRVPRTLALICQKCLEKSPRDRYASAAALADDLQRHLKGEQVEARPAGVIDRAVRWIRREPALSSRLLALAGFCCVELFTYHVLRSVDLWTYHLPILGVVAAWAAASIVLAQRIKYGHWPWGYRFIWAAVDAALLLAAVMIADGAASGLIVVYPLLIVASGLWFRARLVWFTTALSVASYIVLAFDFHLRRTDLMAKYAFGYDRHLACVLALVVIGAVVAYQVRRVRALSHYYEQRQLP